MSDTPSGKLRKQGVSNSNVTKLTPSSPEIISRHQATINKELENNSQKSTSCTKKRKPNESEKNVKATTSIGTSHPINTKKLKIQKVTKDQETLENNTRSPRKLLAPNYKNTNKFEYINSTVSNNKKSNDEKDKKEETLAKIDSNNEKFKLRCDDTAFLKMPTMSNDNADALYNFIISDDRARQYILNGKMLDLEIDKVYDLKGNAYDPKEIDKIVDHIIIFGVHYYLVKWKNWSKGFNTWECFDDLSNSQRLLGDYVADKTNDLNNFKPINGMHLMLSRKLISYFFDLFRTEDGLSLPSISPEDISGLFNSLDIGPQANQIKRKQALNLYLGTISLNSYRYCQLVALKQWEIDINVLSNSYLIKVENNMDLEGPPKSFVYVTKYVPRGNVDISNDPPIGCDCTKNCQFSKKCCNELSGYSRVYDANKCITVAPGCPIYECNRKCKCKSTCNNRVVQLGTTVNISIYKTRKCGWGIKTSQNIKKGQFIALYTGEVITINESEKRLQEKTSFLEYMWNLDFDDQHNFEYIIDGSNYANFTHFINHSCNANLNVYAVWINCLNRSLPELALFSSREISAGEQLTINYFSRCSKNNILKKTGIRCQCNMKNCQGYYF
ncbi:Histone H3-K9 methyltransferase,Chromo/chromo shadow domain,SET domain,Pre-SET domain,Chromo [Cinara cedri]|uniref:Histone H3-K9 methyltransferase,Chromo/chromo shadow domain,SET domain,Pre-SET domain,Chromo n=1 Tax=Cinara cedri TaxID=506608 RepID=A0A5E4M4B0_9HEMI|nr:Histone H3-K9 methyltransferase,Chromo/chromo shadow domain,SET domain,Pre-SET domain,Chromo [Cinara cedri]